MAGLLFRSAASRVRLGPQSLDLVDVILSGSVQIAKKHESRPISSVRRSGGWSGRTSSGTSLLDFVSDVTK